MTNGEYRFLESIKDDINIIFDVGSRSDSLFTGMRKIVHYFDPNLSFLSELSKKNNLNIESKFNSFGLSDKKDLTSDGYQLIDNFDDHYNYCNIICFNEKINK
jgi:hypothetical protein